MYMYNIMSDVEDEKDNQSDASYEDDDASLVDDTDDNDSIALEGDIDESEIEYEDLEALEHKVQEQKKKATINTSALNIEDDDMDNISVSSSVSDDSSDEEDDDEYVKRFEKIDAHMKQEHIENYHNTCVQKNYQEIATLSVVVRNERGEVVDPFHRTIPMLTKYERARVLGQRAKQINNGASIFVKPHQETIDGYLIALQELEEKKLPFIIRRPLPNGISEYWKVKDLEYLHEIAY
jgi:DNA-directed RNA polymerase subunit K/omega